MKKEQISIIEEDIELYKRKLRELEPYIEEDEAMAVLYNQTLVDKAVLVHKLDNMNQSENVFSKIKKVLTIKKHKKQICDYFMK